MNWKQIYHNESSDGKFINSIYHLFMDFPVSEWNNKTQSPVIIITYNHRIVEGGWWLDSDKTKWHVHPPCKQCRIYFSYFERFPEIKLYAYEGREHKGLSYEDFTIENIQKYASEVFKERLMSVVNQIQI